MGEVFKEDIGYKTLVYTHTLIMFIHTHSCPHTHTQIKQSIAEEQYEQIF